MAAEDIEKKVRKMSSQKPEDGKDLQQLQEAQNQIVQINAERQGNLQMARLENNANAANNETMSQAVEMASLGGLGGAAVQQQVQAMNPQTQAVLGKYGLGQPRVQRSSSRNVQVTPQKITINNNTTNTTTNNVAVPAANIGGPVQGRTLAIKQDESQARFKTWISNAFAKQNQQAAVREKEYQRREWSLTRSTNKLMKHLSDLGKSVSERLNPQKLASSVGNQFRTILFLFGTTFLAKNWEKVIEYGAKIENFLFGARGEGINGERGKSGLSKMLISAFGGDPNNEKSTVLNSLKDLFYTGDEKRPGAFDYLFLKIKNYFSEGAEAVKNLELPKIDTDDLLGSLKNIVGYLGNVMSALFTGAEGLKKGIDNQVKEVSKNSKYGLTSDGKKDLSWINDRKDVNEKLGNFYTQDFRESYGNLKGYEDLVDSKGRLTDIARGDIIHSRDKDANNYVRYIDVNESGELTGTIGSTFRASNAVSSMLSDKETVNTVGVTSLLGDIEKAVDNNEKSGDKKGIAIESSEFLTKTGLTLDDIDELKKRGDITEGTFKYVLEPKTLEELAFEYKNQPPGPEEAALKAGLQTHLENVTGIGDLKKWGFRLAGLAGGIALCFVPGGQALAIPLISTGLAAGELTAQASQSPVVRGGLAALNTKKARVLPRYTMRLVDVNDPRPGVDLGHMGDMSTITVPKNQKNATIVSGYRIKKEVINRIKDRIGGFKEKDSNGNISYKSFDLTDSSVRSSMDNYVRGVQATLYGKVSEKVDYDLNNYKGVQKVLDLKTKNQEYEQKVFENSPMKKSIDYISGGIDSARDYLGLGKEIKYPPLTQDRKDFVDKMRSVYKSVLEEKGIDTKYTDVLVAQSALESNWGKNQSGKFNLSGIKADKDDISKGLYTICNTYEYENGVKVPKRAPFRDFESLEDFAEYKVNFVNRKQYKAFDGDSINDYINRIVKGGYATAPDYGKILADVVNNIQKSYPSLDTITPEKDEMGDVKVDPTTYMAENIAAPDNYVEEKKPESNYLSQLVLDEKSYNPEFSIPSFNSPFLASTSFTTPNSATKVPTIDTPMILAKTIGKEITSSNNDSATISDILKTTNLLNDNIKLLQQGQLAQVQATTSIASGLGNMTITVNSGGDKKIPTAGWTKEPYA